MWGWRSLIYSTFQSLATALGVVVVMFLLQNMFGNRAGRIIAGRHSSDNQIERINEQLGLNLPLAQRFAHFMNDLSPVSFTSDQNRKSNWFIIASFGKDGSIVLKWPYLGKSFANNSRVSDLILEGLPETLVLAFSAIFIALFFGIPLGVFAAQFVNSWIDKVITLLASTGMAVPSFLAAIFLGWLFGFQLHAITGLSMTGSLFTYDVYAGKELLTLQNLILPAFTLALRPIGVISQLMRDSLIEVNKSDYIRTAFSKGLKPWMIMTHHAFRNAITPVVTLSATSFASLMAGSVFVEYVYGWKGLGHVIVKAIEMNDFPVIMGLTLSVSVTFIFVNWILTFIYPLINPTLRR